MAGLQNKEQRRVDGNGRKGSAKSVTMTTTKILGKVAAILEEAEAYRNGCAAGGVNAGKDDEIR